MSTITIHGFILKKIDFLEKNLIVTIFSKELSKIPAIGIAAKKSKKRNLNLLDYFNYLKFTLNVKKNYPIYIIEKVEIIENFTDENLQYHHFTLLQIINEIINLLVYGTEENLTLFNLYLEILKKMKLTTKENLLNLLTYFKIKSLESVGLKLNFKKCAICGKNGIFLNYSIEKSGFVCNKCNEKTFKIKLGTIKSIEFIENKNLKFTLETINDINKIFIVNLQNLRNKEQLKKLIKLENYFRWIMKK